MYSTCRAHADPSDTLNEAQCLMMHFSFFRLRPLPVTGSGPPATVSSEVARRVFSRPAALAEPPLSPLTTTRHWYTMDSACIYILFMTQYLFYMHTHLQCPHLKQCTISQQASRERLVPKHRDTRTSIPIPCPADHTLHRLRSREARERRRNEKLCSLVIPYMLLCLHQCFPVMNDQERRHQSTKL